ncbi:kinase-like domain-containing protein [Sordaria brevicollis]|uniref:EKC/KEOPS complex subunit BUD32 n=1 Tax=Sordaria brevicollis TaxID=83679 RepID=A0AAE0PIY4_SORBR|nr:kinase-like domain-containing protein [Sordaria brevicollis]
MFGSRANSTERFEYELEYPIEDSDLEGPDCYTEGGFHPIIIGDRLGPNSNGRFRVVTKLGAGGFGTVWLCQDTHYQPSTVTKWRAVKVLAAEKSKRDSLDLKIASYFRDVDSATLDTFGICLPLEHFWLTGPNGRHLVLVFPWHGCTLDIIPKLYGFHPALIKDIAFELAESLRFLHSRGLCHGDLRPNNVLLRLRPGADEMPESELLESEILWEPHKMRIVRMSDDKFLDELPAEERPVNLPEYIVAPHTVPIVSGLYTRHPVLIDLGVSFPSSHPPKAGTTGIPITYAAPESVFRTFDKNSRPLLGPASDIWSLACTLAYLRVSFNPFHNEYLISSVVAQWEGCLSPLPEPYRSQYRSMEDIETPLDEVWGDKPATQLDPVVHPKAEYEGRAQYRLEKYGTRNFFKVRMMREQRVEIYAEKGKKLLEMEEVMQADPKMRELLPFLEDMEVRNPFKEFWEVKMEKEEIEVFWSLLERCWRWNPEDRASMEEVVRHPWFDGRKPKEIPKPGPWRVVVVSLWSFWDYVRSLVMDFGMEGHWSVAVVRKLPPGVLAAFQRMGRLFIALFGSLVPSTLRKKLVWDPKASFSSAPGTPKSKPADSTDWETY